MPIILTDGKNLPNVAPQKIKYIIGGPSKVSINNLNAERIHGKDRYETSYKIADKFYKGNKSIIMASGQVFADALTAAPLAASLNIPIILSPKSGHYSGFENNFSSLDRVIVLGGNETISAEIKNDLKAKNEKTLEKEKAESANKPSSRTSSSTENRFSGVSGSSNSNSNTRPSTQSLPNVESEVSTVDNSSSAKLEELKLELRNYDNELRKIIAEKLSDEDIRLLSEYRKLSSDTHAAISNNSIRSEDVESKIVNLRETTEKVKTLKSKERDVTSNVVDNGGSSTIGTNPGNASGSVATTSDGPRPEDPLSPGNNDSNSPSSGNGAVDSDSEDSSDIPEVAEDTSGRDNVGSTEDGAVDAVEEIEEIVEEEALPEEDDVLEDEPVAEDLVESTPEDYTVEEEPEGTRPGTIPPDIPRPVDGEGMDNRDEADRVSDPETDAGVENEGVSSEEEGVPETEVGSETEGGGETSEDGGAPEAEAEPGVDGEGVSAGEDTVPEVSDGAESEDARTGDEEERREEPAPEETAKLKDTVNLEFSEETFTIKVNKDINASDSGFDVKNYIRNYREYETKISAIKSELNTSVLSEKAPVTITVTFTDGSERVYTDKIFAKIENSAKSINITNEGTVSVNEGGTIQLNSQISYEVEASSGNEAIDWSLEENSDSEHITISESGLLSVRDGVRSNTIKVKATVRGTNISAEKDVTIVKRPVEDGVNPSSSLSNYRFFETDSSGEIKISLNGSENRKFYNEIVKPKKNELTVNVFLKGSSDPIVVNTQSNNSFNLKFHDGGTQIKIPYSYNGKAGLSNIDKIDVIYTNESGEKVLRFNVENRKVTSVEIKPKSELYKVSLEPEESLEDNAKYKISTAVWEKNASNYNINVTGNFWSDDADSKIAVFKKKQL